MVRKSSKTVDSEAVSQQPRRKAMRPEEEVVCSYTTCHNVYVVNGTQAHRFILQSEETWLTCLSLPDAVSPMIGQTQSIRPFHFTNSVNLARMIKMVCCG